ncbi:MAG: hypothetical protein VCE43_11170 [Myxococcota bacterium]
MSNESPFMSLMNAVSENDEFRKELVELAAKHGVDFTHRELDEDELDAVAGGVGDDAQLTNLRLQNELKKKQRVVQAISDASRLLHNTQMAIIREIG